MARTVSPALANVEQGVSRLEAKVSEADVRKTAMTKVPNGTVNDAELEKGDGRLIRAVDITTPGVTAPQI